MIGTQSAVASCWACCIWRCPSSTHSTIDPGLSGDGTIPNSVNPRRNTLLVEFSGSGMRKLAFANATCIPGLRLWACSAFTVTGIITLSDDGLRTRDDARASDIIGSSILNDLKVYFPIANDSV